MDHTGFVPHTLAKDDEVRKVHLEIKFKGSVSYVRKR